MNLNLTNFDEIKEQIRLRLINMDKEESLKEKNLSYQVITLGVEDFIVQPTIDITSNDSETAFAMIDKNLINVWGVDEELVYTQGYLNIPQNFYINNLFGTLMSVVDTLSNEIEPSLDDINVISNKNLFYGASSILSKSKMNMVCELMHTNELYVLPSSVHEVIVVSAEDSDRNIDTFNSMVSDINAETVANKDLLSNNVLLYKRDVGFVSPSIKKYN